MQIRFLTVFFALFLAAVGQATDTSIKPEDINSITIYYTPWHTNTNHSLSIEDIRSHPDYSFSVFGPWNIEGLFKHLPLEKMKPTTVATGDVRLVMDIKLSNGNSISFHATKFYFYSNDNKFCWQLTPEIKDLFCFEKMRLLN
jgi:hypothetical protein